jgi:hypothetical protein
MAMTPINWLDEYVKLDDLPEWKYNLWPKILRQIERLKKNKDRMAQKNR